MPVSASISRKSVDAENAAETHCNRESRRGFRVVQAAWQGIGLDTTAECRGEPLPGPARYRRNEWAAAKRQGLQFGWNRGTFAFSNASSRLCIYGMGHFSFLYLLLQRQERSNYYD